MISIISIFPEEIESIDSKVMNESMPISLNHFKKSLCYDAKGKNRTKKNTSTVFSL